jgi:2-amino-4-hydroxy-6-hydroxymethyldihydropteridine diphosphokinase
MATVYLSLGTNLGDKRRNITRAISLIKERAGEVLAFSSFFKSPPCGFESENEFVNIALKLQTELQPLDLLHALKAIESDMGRPPKAPGDTAYYDRIIDIDILLYDNIHMNTTELSIPHPKMAERDFIMTHLREIY